MCTHDCWWCAWPGHGDGFDQKSRIQTARPERLCKSGPNTVRILLRYFVQHGARAGKRSPSVVQTGWQSQPRLCDNKAQRFESRRLPLRDYRRQWCGFQVRGTKSFRQQLVLLDLGPRGRFDGPRHYHAGRLLQITETQVELETFIAGPWSWTSFQ